MKFTATSLAIIGLCAGAAHAQSNATLYGSLDVGVAYQSTSAPGYSTSVPGSTANLGSQTKLQDAGMGPSKIGIKASESLGDGLEARIQLQGTFTSGTGAFSAISGGMATGAPVGTFFNQLSTVGLAGNWGEVRFGRIIAPMMEELGRTDVREGRYYGSILSSIIGVNSSAGWAGTTTNAPLGAVYDDNSIVYTSPRMSGFKANLQYTLGGIAGNLNAASRKSATLEYEGSGLRLAGIYYSANDAYTLASKANGTNNNVFYNVSGIYTLDGFSGSLGWSNAKNPSGQASGVGALSVASAGAMTLGSAAGNANYRIVNAGLGYTAGSYKLTSGYYRITDSNNSANASNLIVVGLDKPLSKRTVVYLQGARVANSGNMNQGIVYGTPVAAGKTTTGFMMGVRHTF